MDDYLFVSLHYFSQFMKVWMYNPLFIYSFFLQAPSILVTSCRAIIQEGLGHYLVMNEIVSWPTRIETFLVCTQTQLDFDLIVWMTTWRTIGTNDVKSKFRPTKCVREFFSIIFTLFFGELSHLQVSVNTLDPEQIRSVNQNLSMVWQSIRFI